MIECGRELRSLPWHGSLSWPDGFGAGTRSGPSSAGSSMSPIEDSRGLRVRQPSSMLAHVHDWAVISFNTQIIHSLVRGCLCCAQVGWFSMKNNAAGTILDMYPGAHGEVSQGNIPWSGRFGSQYTCTSSSLLDNAKLFCKEFVRGYPPPAVSNTYCCTFSQHSVPSGL